MLHLSDMTIWRKRKTYDGGETAYYHAESEYSALTISDAKDIRRTFMAETPKTNNRNAKKDDYLVQGAILAAAAVLTKIIGVVYRIPLTNILGDEGNGFYGYAYQVYAIALMLSSFSLLPQCQNWFPQDWRYVREEMRSRVYMLSCICVCCGPCHLSGNLLRRRSNFYLCNALLH